MTSPTSGVHRRRRRQESKMFYKPKYITQFVSTPVLSMCLPASPGGPQTTTCGQPQLGPEDSAMEIRFIRADVAHVRASVLRAILVMGANLSKEKAGIMRSEEHT